MKRGAFEKTAYMNSFDQEVIKLSCQVKKL